MKYIWISILITVGLIALGLYLNDKGKNSRPPSPSKETPKVRQTEDKKSDTSGPQEVHLAVNLPVLELSGSGKELLTDYLEHMRKLGWNSLGTRQVQPNKFILIFQHSRATQDNPINLPPQPFWETLYAVQKHD